MPPTKWPPELPPELLVHILSSARDLRRLAAAAAVCRAWNIAACSVRRSLVLLKHRVAFGVRGGTARQLHQPGAMTALCAVGTGGPRRLLLCEHERFRIIRLPTLNDVAATLDAACSSTPLGRRLFYLAGGRPFSMRRSTLPTCADASSDGRRLYLTDLGADRIICCRTPQVLGSAVPTPGTGFLSNHLCGLRPPPTSAPGVQRRDPRRSPPLPRARMVHGAPRVQGTPNSGP